MLYRKIEKNIYSWLKNSNKALLIDGAKKVGKSFIIRKVLKEQHINFYEFNFIKNEKLASLFKSTYHDLSLFINALTFISGTEIKKGSVIFFDEVQVCKEIVTYIKFLVDQGDYKFILSGSLLGVELVNLKSAPVGYLEVLKMYPLDLEEFAINQGVPEDIINDLYESYKNETPVNEVIHNKMMQVYKNYLIVGGMPDAVNAFVKEKNFREIQKIHENIIEIYKKDFTKYETNSKLKLVKIYDLMPSELSDINRRFIFTDVEASGRFNKYENSFNWLIDAGVALATYNLKEPRLPLKINEDSTSFKFFMNDVGLLTSCYEDATKLAILTEENSLNAGAIYENFVAEELKAHGYDLYYFNNRRLGELDFVIELNERALPIEVKSGKDYKKHSALTNVLNNEVYKINKAIVFNKYNVYKEEKILYLPIYMIMFIDKNRGVDIKLNKVVF